MNKERVSLGILALLLVFSAGLTSCSTTDSVSGGVRDPRGNFETISVPDKDFQALGLVFAEASYEQDERGARGGVLTYQALLKEAQALGADYIVNVVIDYKSEGSEKWLFGKKSLGAVKGKVTWYGSATAIKYTDTLKNTQSQINADGKVIATSQTFIMSGAPTSTANQTVIRGNTQTSNANAGVSSDDVIWWKPSTWKNKR